MTGRVWALGGQAEVPDQHFSLLVTRECTFESCLLAFSAFYLFVLSMAFLDH